MRLINLIPWIIALQACGAKEERITCQTTIDVGTSLGASDLAEIEAHLSFWRSAMSSGNCARALHDAPLCSIRIVPYIEGAAGTAITHYGEGKRPKYTEIILDLQQWKDLPVRRRSVMVHELMHTVGYGHHEDNMLMSSKMGYALTDEQILAACRAL
jgi:hypothetical protein